MTSSSSSSGTMPTLDEPFHNDHFDRLPHAPCISLYHRNGRAGCGTYDRSDMAGRLVRWDSVVVNNDNAERRRREATNNSAAAVLPYVAVMDESEFGAESVALLMAQSSSSPVASDNYEEGGVERGGPLRGLIVLVSSSSSSSSSTSSPEPRTHGGTILESLTVGPSYGWNSYGDGLTMTDMYGLPTVYVSDVDTATYLRSVAEEQSSSDNGDAAASTEAYPAIVSEFNYYMGGGGEEDASSALTAQECLEWKDASDGVWRPKCLPLGGNSVWAAAGTPAASSNGNDNDGGNGNDGNDNNAKSVVMLATSIDDTSMFHDIAPGSNGAASNILALLTAARLVGTLSDDVLDGLGRRIAFGFFQGESYGYLGSRSFFNDVTVGFECENGGDDGDNGVPAVFSGDGNDGRRACLSPLRADLSFQNLGQIDGMIAVDRVGNLLDGGKTLYVQGGGDTAPNDEGGLAAFFAEVLVELSPDNSDGGEYSIQASSVAADDDEDDGEYPLPPSSPLNSLVKLSGGAAGGVVLSGYNDAFVGPYHSHLDSTTVRSVDLDAVAAAGTALARAAVAAALYGNDDGNYDDAESAAARALELLPTAASASDEAFTTLATCLYENGNCDLFLNHADVERNNDAVRTGLDLGLGQPLGTPPNYYVSVYDGNNGQAFVRAGGGYYGEFVGGTNPAVAEGEEEEKLEDYGTDDKDTFLLRPSLLEASIGGLLNDYLGRGSFVAEDDGGVPELATCKSSKDCTSIAYCSSNGGDDSTSSITPTCAGGSCICGTRSHYHPALDESFRPASNYNTGRFAVADDDDAGVSAMYTEANWSSEVGVRIYRDAGKGAGMFALGFGLAYLAFCVVAVHKLKGKLTKQKVY